MISKEEFDKIASLSKLRFSDEEEIIIKKEIEQILAYMEKINGVDTAGVQPMYTPLDISAPLRNDEPVEGMPSETFMNEVPSKKDGFVKVPLVIKKRKSL